MQRISFTQFIGLVAIVLSSCSSEETLNSLPDAAGFENYPEIDYTRLLTRTDSAEICARQMQSNMEYELGEGFFPVKYYTLMCECVRDSALSRIQDASPDHPNLHNAILQVSTNYDVINTLSDGNDNYHGFIALTNFLANEGMNELGFDVSDFEQAIAEIESTVDVSMDDHFEYAQNIPSCVTTNEMAKITLPDWDPKTGTAGAEPHLATQRLIHDRKIDLSLVNRIMRAKSINALCPHYESKDIKKNNGVCRDIFDELETSEKILTEPDRLLYLKIRHLQSYVEKNRTTSKVGDLKLYLSLHAHQFD